MSIVMPRRPRFVRIVPVLVVISMGWTGPRSRGQEPAAAVNRVLRSHDIRFLTADIPQFYADRVEDDAPNLALDEEQEEAMGGGFGADFALADSGLSPGSGISPDAIVDLIQSNIAEDSWSNRNNRIEVNGGQLIVIQTTDVQDRIEEFLAALRARRARMVTVDVALVPRDALGDIDPTSTGPLPGGAFQAILDRAGEGGQRVSLTAYNEQTVSAFHGEHRSFLVDDEVSQTGVVPVVRSAPVRFPIGLTVEVRPRVVEGLDRISLDLMLSWLRIDGEPQKRETLFSDIEIVPWIVEELETTLLLEPGQEVLAGAFEEEGDGESRRRFAVLARARPVDVQEQRESPPGDPEAHVLRAYAIELLLEAGSGESSPFSEDLVLEMIRHNVAPDTWRDERSALEVDEGLLLATAPRATHERIAAWLAARLEEVGRTAVADVLEFDGPLDAALDLRALSPDGQLLPENWRESDPAARLRRVFRGTVRGLLGRRIEARGFRARTYVADVESVSGGTGFSVVELPDPIVEHGRTGFALETTVPLVRGRESTILELDLRRYRTRFDRSAEFKIPAELGITASAGTDGEAPPPGASQRPARRLWLTYRMDLIDRDRWHAHAGRTLTRGRDVLLEVRETGSGRARLVVGRVAVTALPERDEPQEQRAGDDRSFRLYDLGVLDLGGDQLRGDLPDLPRIRRRDDSYDEDHSVAVTFGPEKTAGTEVIELVTEFVARDSWENTRNSIEETEGGRLAVVQKAPVLAEIEAFIERLSKRSERKLGVELALVPPAALDETSPGWSQPGRAPWLEGGAMDRALRAAGAGALYLCTYARPGALATFIPQEVSTHLGDHEVNQTGVTPVVNPRIEARSRGVFAEARVFLDPEASWCRADITLGRVDVPDEAVERRRLPRGDLDLFRTAQDRTATTVTGLLDRTLLLGSYSPSAGELAREAGRAFVALVRVRKLFTDSPDTVSDLTILDCGLLSRPLLGPRSFGDEGSADEDGSRAIPLVDPALLEADLNLLLGENARLRLAEDRSALYFRAPPEATGRARNRLRTVTRENVRPVTLDLWQGVVDTGGLQKLDGETALLGEDWLERFSDSSGTRVRTAGISSVVQTLHSVSSWRFVKNVERVSGGTGFVILEVGDPVVASSGAGLAVKAQVSLVPGTGWAQVRIQGELAGEPSFGRQTRVRETQSVRAAPDREGGAEADGDWITIDLPEERSEHWEHLVTVPLGRPALLNALPDRQDPSKTRVLIAVVHAFEPDAADGEER